MTDCNTTAEDTPPPGLPLHVRRLIAPWWLARATRLAAMLEAADDAGEATVELDGRNVTVEHLTEMAKHAIEMVEQLEAEACT